MKLFATILTLTVLGTPLVPAAKPADAVQTMGEVDLNLDHRSRTKKEKSRDRNRKPKETLAFFGLRDDMRVIELFPGSGWYTKLIGPYVADKGALFIALGTDDLKPKLSAFGLDKVHTTGNMKNFTKTDAPGYIFSVDSIDLQERNIDMVLTFRNAHNLNAAGRLTLNRAVFDALKPGGIYGIVDHTKRHMEGIKAWTWRRTDPVQIIHEAITAGFEFVGYSNLHRRPEDELLYDTRHESLVNESDRYTLKFRKPK